MAIMSNKIIEDQTFSGKNFLLEPLELGDYENCQFIGCNFAGCDLSEFEFADCHFEDCNLSNVRLAETGLKTVSFKGCKLLGLIFSDCNEFLFAVSFENCQLNLSSFFRLKMSGTQFVDCEMHEVDFTDSNLSKSNFQNCDLSGATFEKTNLEKADFRTSYNYSIHPEINKLKQAKFSMPAVVGLLHHFGIVIE
jgi:uncharacterized protein YjbI with pentapeptide repeats